MTCPTSALSQQLYPSVWNLATPKIELTQGSRETLHFLKAKLVPHGGGGVVFVLIHVLAKDQETTWKNLKYFVINPPGFCIKDVMYHS